MFPMTVETKKPATKEGLQAAGSKTPPCRRGEMQKRPILEDARCCGMSKATRVYNDIGRTTLNWLDYMW